MSVPPRTPLRKVLAAGSPHSSRQQIQTPTSLSKKPIVGASPAVRAAIAAAKAQRPPPPSFLLETSTSSIPDDRESIGGFGNVSEGITLKVDSKELLDEWGMKTIDSLIETARTSGRLNLASRSLQVIPAATYSALIAESSPYHPDNRKKGPPSSKVVPVDYTIIAVGEVAPTTVWFEQTDLITLNVGNNELRVLDDEVGGMEWLETLDLHNNYFHKVPLSICFLRSLTTLNLSSNHLAEFPLQILSLVALKDLNLSSNLLDTLWSTNWESELTDLLYEIRNPPVSPSASPSQGASATLSGHFGEFSMDDTTEVEPRPFPNLKKLSLGGNRFKRETFRNGFTFPSSLVELDLSGNGIRERDLDISQFSGLKKLEVLDLSGNELGDDWFSEVAVGSDIATLFPSLKSIDLSKNDLEELGQLEAYIEGSIGGRKIDWTGLPKIIANLVHASGVLSDINGTSNSITQSLEVRVIGNPLSREQVRRRATFPSALNGYSVPSSPMTTEAPTLFIGTPSATPVMSRVSTSIPSFPESPTKKRVEKEEWEIQAEAGLATEGGRRRARIEAARREKEEKETFQLLKVAKSKMLVEETQQHAMSPPPIPISEPLPPPLPTPLSPVRVVPAPLPVVVEVDSAPSDPLALELFSSSSSSINFSKRSLSKLPAGGPNRILPPIPSSLDLSHNLFTSLPISSIISWKWTNLRTLNLSNNALSSHDLISSIDGTLSNLESIDLSYNQLNSTISSDSQTSSLFDFISSLCPNLVSLDLSYNNLNNLNGIDGLMTSKGGKGKGIKNLNLRGNKIIDLESLCELAKDVDTNNQWKKIAWNCEVLDLQDNSIGRLSPILGLLPSDLELLVAGNPFRLPRPDVYINGGSRGLLAWLKERV